MHLGWMRSFGRAMALITVRFVHSGAHRWSPWSFSFVVLIRARPGRSTVHLSELLWSSGLFGVVFICARHGVRLVYSDSFVCAMGVVGFIWVCWVKSGAP